MYSVVLTLLFSLDRYYYCTVNALICLRSEDAHSTFTLLLHKNSIVMSTKVLFALMHKKALSMLTAGTFFVALSVLMVRVVSERILRDKYAWVLGFKVSTQKVFPSRVKNPLSNIVYKYIHIYVVFIYIEKTKF